MTRPLLTPAVSAVDISADPISDSLDADDRAACAVVADLLTTARLWSAPALGGLAVAGWAVVTQASTWPLPLRAAALLALGLLLGVERYLAIRVALDARLFGRLALGSLDSLAALDQALTAQLALPPAKAGRPLAPRLTGARRLYRLHAGAALVCSAQAGWGLLAWAR